MNRLSERPKPRTPVGTMVQYVGSEAPEGWLKCDGLVYPVTLFPRLAALLNATGKNFNTPNLDSPVGIWMIKV